MVAPGPHRTHSYLRFATINAPFQTKLNLKQFALSWTKTIVLHSHVVLVDHRPSSQLMLEISPHSKPQTAAGSKQANSICVAIVMSSIRTCLVWRSATTKEAVNLSVPHTRIDIVGGAICTRSWWVWVVLPIRFCCRRLVRRGCRLGLLQDGI